VVGEFLSYDPYGIAFRRNEPELHASVERAVRNLVIARDIGAIYAKWFESRLPNGERFNIPMKPQLEESFKVLGKEASRIDAAALPRLAFGQQRRVGNGIFAVAHAVEPRGVDRVGKPHRMRGHASGICVPAMRLCPPYA